MHAMMLRSRRMHAHTFFLYGLTVNLRVQENGK